MPEPLFGDYQSQGLRRHFHREVMSVRIRDFLLDLQFSKRFHAEVTLVVRRDDGRVIKFRVEHLDDCFEEVEVEEERYL